MNKKNVVGTMGVLAALLVWWATAHAAIGTGAEVAKALGITERDITRIQVALGKHQSLGRDATLAEVVKEMVSRMNVVVLQEEGKVKRAEIEAEMVPITSIEPK